MKPIIALGSATVEKIVAGFRLTVDKHTGGKTYFAKIAGIDAHGKSSPYEALACLEEKLVEAEREAQK